MKKVLLSLCLMAGVFISNAQLFLSELYVRPNPNNGSKEYFELFNIGLTPYDASCYTLVTYFHEGNERGFYVVDIPNTTLSAQGFLTMTSSMPLIYQNGQGSADFSWNDGYISRYVFRNGPGGGSLQLDNSGAPYTDIFLRSAGVYGVFLFKGNNLVDAFVGQSNSIDVPQPIVNMGLLSHTRTGGGCSLSYNFNGINNEDDGKFGSHNAEAGTDNGYHRVFAGLCPTLPTNVWEKTAPPHMHTPDMPNYGSDISGAGGKLAVDYMCNTNTSDVMVNVTGGVQGAYPLTLKLYSDNNANFELDNGDALLDTRNNYSGGSVTMHKNGAGGEIFFLTVDANGDCFDQVIILECQSGIILPVSLKSFNARRNGGNVALTWETSSETNNSGFYIERKTGNNWETITFIPSQSADGNSNSPLSYSYSDANTARGVSQYRLRQVDHDRRAKYSEIRSVRGNGVMSKTIVYPNPTNDGTVNVVFEEVETSRDIMVSDMSGRIIKQWRNITNNNLVIDNLNPGMYMIRITDKVTGENVNEKIVVNRR